MDVRPYTDADREPVRALLRRTFGSSEVYDRLATGNPLGEQVAVVAEHEAAVVGFNMWNPWLVQGARGPLTAYQSGASAVDDTMRGQGIFGKLLRAGEALARARGVSMLFGFPNPASLPGFLKAGWEHPSSLRLFASTVPSLGLGPLRAAVATPRSPTTDAGRFIAWRYGRAGVDTWAARLRDGRAVTIYTRTTHRRGAAVNKLLDVVDGDGRRVSDALGTIGARLPGPGVTLMRAVRPPRGLPPWVPIRREWATPLILKRLIAGAAPDDASVREASYWYGDIDAS